MLFKGLSVGQNSYGNVDENDDNYMNDVELLSKP